MEIGERKIWQKVGFYLGPIAFACMLWMQPSFVVENGGKGTMSLEAWKVACSAVWMAIWWVTESVPIPITSLLPIPLFFLLNVSNSTPKSHQDILSPYADPIIYLFLGGFMLAIGMEKWNLHKRIALNIIKIIGTKPSQILLGFLVATALISMWASNASTAIMMLPIAITIQDLLKDKVSRDKEKDLQNFETGLLLCIAYGASIGGLGTLIGTPPNAILKAFIDKNQLGSLNFANWILFGSVLILVSIPIVYVLITKIVYPVRMGIIPGTKELIETELDKLGKIAKPEIYTLIVIISTAFVWIFRGAYENLPFIKNNLKDGVVAMTGGLLLFTIPVDWKRNKFLLDWSDMKLLPWDVLLLFGGGLSLASAVDRSGLSVWMGDSTKEILSGENNIYLIVFAVTAIVLFLTEFTSNTATITLFLPIGLGIAQSVGVDPRIILIPATVASSCAFMLPVGTAPNAIVFSSGRLKIPQMARVGVWMNLVFVVIISFLTFAIGTKIFGIVLP
jgi:sodium-dependent dicarboxylate transporter 2/3/5